MHHSREMDEAMRERAKDFADRLNAMEVKASEVRKAEAEQMKLGATGAFPEGKLTEQDEGEIKLAIGVDQGQVIINFGKPVAWIGLSPKQARQLAEVIRKQSYKAEVK